MSANIKLMKDDCLAAMKEIKNGSVDMILTDPPYKVTSRGGYTSAGGMMLNKDVRKGKVFKENSIRVADWMPTLYEKLADSGHCYVMCNNKNLQEFINESTKAGFHLVKTMVWAKDNKIMSQAYMSQIEFVLFLRKGRFKRINNCGDSDLLQHKNPKNKSHPTEKPVSLMSQLIANSSAIGSLVLDPFMGTGSSGVAAKELGRNFIGIELDENYFDIANKRISES